MKINRPISLYWKCQLIGWSVASLYWGYAAFVQTPVHFSIAQALADFILDVGIGIGLTHGYRNLALRANWHLLTLKTLVPRIAPAIVVLSVLYMICIIGKLYAVRFFFNQQLAISFKAFFTNNWLTVFITGTRLMSIWVLAYHLYHYARQQINTAKENARLQVIAKEAQLSNLSAQLNPHFFFNSLNNIKFLVGDDPATARRAIDLLSDLLRNSLYGKEDKLIALKEEMNLAKDYLELEKLRFEERLQVHMAVQEELADIFIPPFSIRALVENAIKHGVEKRKDGGLITVNVVQEDSRIQIIVQNPGKLHTEKATGIGLQNLQERLRLQYNGKAQFVLEELPGEKISATISIPVV